MNLLPGQHINFCILLVVVSVYVSGEGVIYKGYGEGLYLQTDIPKSNEVKIWIKIKF